MIRFAEREGPITKIGLGLLDAPHHFESSDIRTIRESALEALSREELEGYTSWTIRKENINGKVFKPVIGLGLFTQLPYNILKVHAFEPLNIQSLIIGKQFQN